MSYSQLTKITHPYPHFREYVSQRHTHNAPDHHYLREGMQHLHYQRYFRKALPLMQNYPNLMNRYFKVSAKMTLKGLIPFVHAQGLEFRPTRQFLESLSGKTGHFRLWRIPSAKHLETCQSIQAQIAKYLERHRVRITPEEFDDYPPPLDETAEFRPKLLSMSYTMMDFAKKESAYDFLFSTRCIKTKMAQECSTAVAHSLKIRGLEKHATNVLQALETIQARYKKLNVGGLFVIGIPKKSLKTYTYDSKAFGIPTGLDIAEVVKNLNQTQRAFSNKLQARLILCKETLTSSSGIETIDIHDQQEVERYYEDTVFKEPESLEVYEPIFQKKNSPIEKELENVLADLDKEVKTLSLQLLT